MRPLRLCLKTTVSVLLTHSPRYVSNEINYSAFLWPKPFRLLAKRLKHESDLILGWLKLWPKGLASQPKFSTCVQLALRLVAHLRWITMTCVDFGPSQIHVQVDTSFSAFGYPTQVDTSWSRAICICVKFMTFATCVNVGADLWIRLATKRKSTQVDYKSSVYAWNLHSLRLSWTCQPTCESVWPPIARPCTQVLVWPRLASPFGQGFNRTLKAQVVKRSPMNSRGCPVLP